MLNSHVIEWEIWDLNSINIKNQLVSWLDGKNNNYVANIMGKNFTIFFKNNVKDTKYFTENFTNC